MNNMPLIFLYTARCAQSQLYLLPFFDLGMEQRTFVICFKLLQIFEECKLTNI